MRGGDWEGPPPARAQTGFLQNVVWKQDGEATGQEQRT